MREAAWEDNWGEFDDRRLVELSMSVLILHWALFCEQGACMSFRVVTPIALTEGALEVIAVVLDHPAFDKDVVCEVAPVLI